jgi:hypothetical protein
MSDPERPKIKLQEPAEGESSQGPNLVLLYTLIALALALAIACAAMIVLPFFRRTSYYKQHDTFLSGHSLPAAQFPVSRPFEVPDRSTMSTGIPSSTA